MDTDRVILASSVITLGSTLAHSMLPEKVGGKGELPSARLLIGSAMAFTGLSILGMGAPRIASALAITMGTTAAIFYGVPIADNFFNDNGKATP
jgi:hypothetical protein